jgi:hypothetical protein
MFKQVEIEEIAKIIQKHYALLIFNVLGNEALSDEDRFVLEGYGLDIERFKMQFPQYLQMFYLGRLTALLKDDQVRTLNNVDFKKYLDRGQFIPLSERERAEYRISREMTYGHIKGLANKVTDESRNKMLEQNKMSLIQTEISEGIKNRKSIQSIVSDLGHKTGEWDRDWKRIVVTEMQNIYNQGRAATIQEKYGDSALIYKQVFPLACRHCIKLYLTNGVGSQPKIFTLTELVSNGNNIGKKVDDWKPVIGTTHPHCRCDVRNVHKGQVWNETIGQFEYGERERKVIRTSKIKILVGDKEFLI